MTDGARTIMVDNGVPLLARMIATGWELSARVATYRAVETESLLAATAATVEWSVAAKRAAEGRPGPGTFAVRLIDEIGELDPDIIERYARISRG